MRLRIDRNVGDRQVDATKGKDEIVARVSAGISDLLGEL